MSAREVIEGVLSKCLAEEYGGCFKPKFVKDGDGAGCADHDCYCFRTTGVYSREIHTALRDEGWLNEKPSKVRINDPNGLMTRPQADIYSEDGQRVVFAYPESGYPHHQETAAKHLTEGATYTIEHTEVGGWHTDFFLWEVPGVAFNSVHFAPAPETADD